MKTAQGRKNNMNNKSFFKSKKMKYGSAAAALTVIVIALVLVLNVVVTSLSQTYSWYTDLTGTSIYSLSDAFCGYLDDIVNPKDGEKVYVNVVIMMDEDEFESHSTYTNYVYHTIKQMEKKFDNVKLVSKNILKTPEYKKRYQLNDADPVYTTDVAIELADSSHAALVEYTPKRYAIENFFSTTTTSSGTTSIYGYNAEIAFLSAIQRLVISTDRPVAYYLQGHGEPTLDNFIGWTDSKGTGLLDTAGYDVKSINLAYENFPYETGSKHNSDILIINCPIYDLLAPTEENPDIVSEAAKIRAFLQQNYGNLIVLEDSSTPTLYALEELLSEWNLGYGSSVTDSSHSVSGSGAVKIFADYGELDSNNAVALGLLDRIVNTGASESYPDAIFSSPKSVVIKNDANGDGISDTKNTNNTDGMLVATNSGSHGACELLASYKTATCGGAAGSVPLAGMAYVTWDRNDDNGTYSCVFCFGSGSFVGESSVNNSIMNMVIAFINRNESVGYDGINIKKFDDQALSGVSTSAANTWTVVCVAVIPASIIILGMFVWIRRRHS